MDDEGTLTEADVWRDALRVGLVEDDDADYLTVTELYERFYRPLGYINVEAARHAADAAVERGEMIRKNILRRTKDGHIKPRVGYKLVEKEEPE